MVGIIIVAGIVAFLFFRQIPKQVAKNTEVNYTIATPEPATEPTLIPEVGSQSAPIKTSEDLMVTSGDLDEINLDEFDKELNEIDF